MFLLVRRSSERRGLRARLFHATKFPRTPLLGVSVNRGSSGCYEVRKALRRSIISSRVLSVGSASPDRCEPILVRGTIAKEALVLSVDSSISLSQSQYENATSW